MTCKDLMVGNWVQGHLPNTPSKVVGIPNEYRLAVITPGGAYMELSIDDFLPIPITPEILEKNGFNETDTIVYGVRKMRWTDDDGRTEITIWFDDTMPMEIRKNIYYEDEESYSLPFPSTVHQLQHSLLLLGIEKEIVL